MQFYVLYFDLKFDTQHIIRCAWGQAPLVKHTQHCPAPPSMPLEPLVEPSYHHIPFIIYHMPRTLYHTIQYHTNGQQNCIHSTTSSLSTAILHALRSLRDNINRLTQFRPKWPPRSAKIRIKFQNGCNMIILWEMTALVGFKSMQKCHYRPVSSCIAHPHKPSLKTPVRWRKVPPSGHSLQWRH